MVNGTSCFSLTSVRIELQTVVLWGELAWYIGKGLPSLGEDKITVGMASKLEGILVEGVLLVS